MLSLHGENEIEIKVKMINNEIFTIVINKGKSVLELKEVIRRKINIPIVNQVLNLPVRTYSEAIYDFGG